MLFVNHLGLRWGCWGCLGCWGWRGWRGLRLGYLFTKLRFLGILALQLLYHVLAMLWRYDAGDDEIANVRRPTHGIIRRRERGTHADGGRAYEVE